jgi:hypothetical protein
MFKRDADSKVKGEYPNMTETERAAVIKHEWAGLSIQEKQLFEIKRRAEEEKLKYKQIKSFYDERINFARAVHPLPDMTQVLASLVDKIPITYRQKAEDPKN